MTVRITHAACMTPMVLKMTMRGNALGMRSQQEIQILYFLFYHKNIKEYNVQLCSI